MKTSLLFRPHAIFLLTSGVLLLLSYFKRDYLFDFQLYDTYVVLNFAHLAIPMATWMILSGTIYWLYRKQRLIGLLTWIHTVATISIVFLLSSAAYTSRFGIEDQPESLRMSGELFVPGVFVWLLVQAIFFVNIGIALRDSLFHQR